MSVLRSSGSSVSCIQDQESRPYAGHTQKMINRDLNALQDMSLVHRTRSGVQPAIDQMRAFLPLRAAENHQPGKE